MKLEDKMKEKIKTALNECLMAMLGSEQLVNDWWKSPNKAFDMMTPNEVWEEDYDRVRSYVVGFLQR